MASPILVIQYWLEKPNFHIIFHMFPGNKSRWPFLLYPKIALIYAIIVCVKIIVNLQLQAFWQNFEIEKCKNLVSVYKTLKNLLQNH